MLPLRTLPRITLCGIVNKGSVKENRIYLKLDKYLLAEVSIKKPKAWLSISAGETTLDEFFPYE